jgi:hypothetical protein
VSDIFISYAREDVSIAAQLADALRSRGWSVFWDRRIPAGKRFADVISSELASARSVIVLWSSAANASDWVLEEADDARQRGILAPARIEPVEPPLGFRRIHAADLVGWRGDLTHQGYQQLVDDIAQALRQPLAAAIAPARVVPAAEAPPSKEPPRVHPTPAAASSAPPSPSSGTADDTAASTIRESGVAGRPTPPPAGTRGWTHVPATRWRLVAKALLVVAVAAGLATAGYLLLTNMADSPTPGQRQAAGADAGDASRQADVPKTTPDGGDDGMPASGPLDSNRAAAAATSTPSLTLSAVRNAYEITMTALPDALDPLPASAWWNTASADLRSRMQGLHAAVPQVFAKMDETGRTEGFVKAFQDFADYREVIGPASVDLDLPRLTGRWQCRQLGAGAHGVIAYTYFDCAITAESGCLRLKKTSGSQRFDGCIHRIGDRDAAFIGTWETDYNRGRPGTYGGFLSRTARDRIRIIIPGGPSGLGVVDLKRPARAAAL